MCAFLSLTKLPVHAFRFVNASIISFRPSAHCADFSGRYISMAALVDRNHNLSTNIHFSLRFVWWANACHLDHGIYHTPNSRSASKDMIQWMVRCIRRMLRSWLESAGFPRPLRVARHFLISSLLLLMHPRWLLSRSENHHHCQSTSWNESHCKQWNSQAERCSYISIVVNVKWMLSLTFWWFPVCFHTVQHWIVLVVSMDGCTILMLLCYVLDHDCEQSEPIPLHSISTSLTFHVSVISAIFLIFSSTILNVQLCVYTWEI